MRKKLWTSCGGFSLLLMVTGIGLWWLTRPAQIDWHSRSRDGVSDLRAVRWEGKNLAGADLSGIIFREAWLIGANLQGANLRGADLSGATYLDDADLRQADLTAALLQGTHARRANFAGAILKEANLQGANLSGANLSQVDLTGANLEQANLTAANLSDWLHPPASLNQANLTDAKLPDNLDALSNISRCGTTMPSGQVARHGCFWPSEALIKSLKSNHWQAAENATSRLLSNLRGVSESAIQPQCVELQKLDALWQEASGGRFSFSVQRSLWESPAINQDYGKFAEAVGWKQDGRWLKFEDLQFSESMAADETIPAGYLPWHRWQVQAPTATHPTQFVREGFGQWMARLKACGI